MFALQCFVYDDCLNNHTTQIPESAVGDLLTIWDFLKTFGSVIGVHAPTLRELHDAVIAMSKAAAAEEHSNSSSSSSSSAKASSTAAAAAITDNTKQDDSAAAAATDVTATASDATAKASETVAEQ